MSALSSSMEMSVLHVLCGAETGFTAPMIHRLLPEEGSLPGVRYALRGLVEQGLVLETSIGRIRTYALNREHLLADALTIMTRAKRILLERIRDQVFGWSPEPVAVTLFGSAARDEMKTGSDIDLFFLMPAATAAERYEANVAELTRRVSGWTGNDVRPLVYDEGQVADDALFRAIRDEGVHIFGDRHILARLIQGLGSAA